MAAIMRGTGPTDPAGRGAVYVTDGQTKRHLATFQEVDDIVAAFGITTGDPSDHHITTVQQSTLDAIPVSGPGQLGGTITLSGSLTPKAPTP